MKGFAKTIHLPTNPTDVLAKPVDDVVVKDVGEEVMLTVLVTNVDVAIEVTVPAALGVDAVVVVAWLPVGRFDPYFSQQIQVSDFKISN